MYFFDDSLLFLEIVLFDQYKNEKDSDKIEDEEIR